MEKKPITPVAAGIIIGLVSVVLFLVYYFTGLVFLQNWTSSIPTVINIALICLFISQWSNANNNYVTYGQCFGFGFRSVCVAALITFVFTFAFIYLVPDYQAQMLQVTKDTMRQNKQITEEQIDKGMEIYKNYFRIAALGGTLFFTVLIGVVASLIGAAIAKKKPVSPFTNINQIGTPES